MKTQFILYDPEEFKNAQLKPDTTREELEALRAENARLREALKGWQDWWKLPWQDRRPDIANVRYMKARKAMGESDEPQ